MGGWARVCRATKRFLRERVGGLSHKEFRGLRFSVFFGLQQVLALWCTGDVF